MNREDIVRMAQEAGGYVRELAMGDAWLFVEEEYLERFANLVASAEREACAELTDSRCQCGGLIQSRGQS